MNDLNKKENEFEANMGDPLAPESIEAPVADTAEALKKELEDAKNQTLRALAEAENTRKRAVKEREDASKYAVAKFARDILSVADNLRRALESVPDDLAAGDERIKNVIEGVQATERELLKSLELHGIRKIDPDGETFNPNFHEVMFETPGTGKPPGTVIQVIETGYILHDRLLRPARVGVAKDDGQANGGAEPGGQVDKKI